MRKYLIILSFFITTLNAGEFTVCSYNCGGLSNHYDYIRAVCMQNLIQERYNTEPQSMSDIEKTQKIALKALFTDNQEEKDNLDTLSSNALWYQKSEKIVTNYKIRPVVIHDEEIKAMLFDHLRNLAQDQDNDDLQSLLTIGRYVMGERIFHHRLKYDIICLQEANYLNAAMFPDHYDVRFSETGGMTTGVAWNTERFELLEDVGSLVNRGYAVKLLDKEDNKSVIIASGHITGCHPFKIVDSDSTKGDKELKTILQTLEENEADIKLIGMDSNVASTHPRLGLLKERDFILDYENFLEPTCTNPNFILNTRIDWIAVKALEDISITNIQVQGVNLNSLETNISDHKPIAALIRY